MIIMSQVHHIGLKLLDKIWEISFQTFSSNVMISFLCDFEFGNKYDWIIITYMIWSMETINDKLRYVSSYKPLRYELILIDKGIGYIVGLKFQVFHGEFRFLVVCFVEVWICKVRIDRLHHVLRVWNNMYKVWIVGFVTFDC